jgi:hypothetical protein
VGSPSRGRVCVTDPSRGEKKKKKTNTGCVWIWGVELAKNGEQEDY